MSTDDREHVFGVEVDGLPEGWQPVEVLVIVKCLLPEGEGMGSYALAQRYSDGLQPWDVAGLLRAATLTTDMDLTCGAERGEDEEL